MWVSTGQEEGDRLTMRYRSSPGFSASRYVSRSSLVPMESGFPLRWTMAG